VNPEKVEAFGKAMYARSVSRRRGRAESDVEVVGLDTEYDSRTGEFVCWQVATAGGSALRTEGLSVGRLVREIDRQLGRKPEVLAVYTYFSIAELQWFPVFTDAARYFTAARGSLDVLFEWDGRQVWILDLARWFDGESLANAAESLGLRKLQYERTRVSHASLRSASFRSYAIHDAVLARAIALRLGAAFQTRGADLFLDRTPASASATVYRRHYLRRTLKPPPGAVRKLAMLACWGGRAEAFYRGNVGPVYEYDLQSAYPNAALALGVLPTARSWHAVSRLRDVVSARGGIARVQFQFPSGARYPCLPVVSEGYQLYPLEGESYATFAEVLCARGLGASVRLIEAYGYTRGDDSLARYLRVLLREREKATGAERVALKLLANSMIGKLAQAIEDVSLEDLRAWAKEAGISLYSAAQIHPLERQEMGFRRKLLLGSVFYPEWNALITGQVRARLAGLIHGTEAVYCATDSVWARRRATGGTDLAFKRSGSATIARTRLAALWPLHVVHHSIHDRDVAKRLLKSFRETNEDRKVDYTIRHPVKALESLRLRLPFGRWVEKKMTAGTYWDGKRALLPGGETRPWKDLSEWTDWKEATYGKASSDGE